LAISTELERAAIEGCGMTEPGHKFEVGQAVEYFPPRQLYAPRGRYIVTAALPARSGEYEYQIRHPSEEHDRVAMESDLRKVE
jgi:hypothetical protein